RAQPPTALLRTQPTPATQEPVCWQPESPSGRQAGLRLLQTPTGMQIRPESKPLRSTGFFAAFEEQRQSRRRKTHTPVNGRLSVATVPSSGLLRSFSWPPCATATRFTSARPRPLPSTSAVRPPL